MVCLEFDPKSPLVFEVPSIKIRINGAYEANSKGHSMLHAAECRNKSFTLSRAALGAGH